MAETHEIVIVKPKPDPAAIVEMTAKYFNARGREYDSFDAQTPKRDLFTETVNRLVAESLRESKPEKVLSIACGTGRREVDIRTLSGRPIEFTCVEVSPEMAELAKRRGFEVFVGAWPAVELTQTDFNAALVLSAFGHVPTPAARLEFLRRLSAVLTPGAKLIFDVLNLDDRDEWGPRIQATHDREVLGESGFDPGDVLYRKIGEPEICFYHYFTEGEIRDLLARAGFALEEIWRIGYGARFGEILDGGDGALLIQAANR